MNRRDFMKLGAGAVLTARAAVSHPDSALGAGHTRQGAMILPKRPGFRTKHLVTILLGGARKKDFLDNAELAPHHLQMTKEATVFAEDYGETADLHGYMYSELLSGHAAPCQRPLYPTWNEYVRKKTEATASDFWVLQPASYYRAWTWDVKHFSRHPDYGASYGATSLTMSKIFGPGKGLSAKDLVERDVERSLGHSAGERRRIEAFVDDAQRALRGLPSTREPLVDRALQVSDCRSLLMVERILHAFKPKMITVQVLGLDDAHTEFGFSEQANGHAEYVRHVKILDELIGRLWAGIRAEPYFRDTTALVIRPDCGRDDEVDRWGNLGHTPGNPSAHDVWTMALGPDFRKGHRIHERVERRDLAPTLTYLMSGEAAEYASGHVRTQAFTERYPMPPYVLPPVMRSRPPMPAMPAMIEWSGIAESRRARRGAVPGLRSA